MRRFLYLCSVLSLILSYILQAATFSSYASIAFVDVPQIDISALMDVAQRGVNTPGSQAVTAELARSAYQQMDASFSAISKQNNLQMIEVLVACN